MSTISLAGFKVYGSAIVEMARDMVLAGEWAKALNTFEETLMQLMIMIQKITNKPFVKFMQKIIFTIMVISLSLTVLSKVVILIT